VPSWKWRYFTLCAADKKLVYYVTDTDKAPKGGTVHYLSNTQPRYSLVLAIAIARAHSG